MTETNAFDVSTATLAGLVQHARAKAKLTLAALAEKSGVTERSISDYQAGKPPATLQPLKAIFTACDTIEYLQAPAVLIFKQSLGYTEAPLRKLTLGQQLRNVRIDAGMSLEEVADKAGIGFSSLSLYETDRSAPRSAHVVENIFEACGAEDKKAYAVACWKAPVTKPSSPDSFASRHKKNASRVRFSTDFGDGFSP